MGVAFDPLKIEDLFRHIVGYAANKLYRTSFVLDNDLLFQEIRTHGDLSFSYAGLAAAKRVVYIDTPFYHHRIRKGSLSDTTQESHWHCLFEALDNLRSELTGLIFGQNVNVILLIMYCRWRNGSLVALAVRFGLI